MRISIHTWFAIPLISFLILTFLMPPEPQLLTKVVAFICGAAFYWGASFVKELIDYDKEQADG